MSPQASRIVLGVEDIDRKYEVLEKLAEGGMGAIYRARHVLLEEIRVIKTVRAQHRDDPQLRERFLREARVATHLHHPNIARIHDLSVGEDDTACIVMEFVRGVNLAERLRRDPPLGQQEILELAHQTLDALDYLHQRKIVHRDVSPDNIMLARDADGRAQVKLIDLGIAKPLEGAGFQTKTATFIGKIRYASPEQLGAGGASSPTSGAPPAIDGRSDLYSLGVVLCELLTGELPIRGTDEASVIAGHLFHPPRAFSEIDPDGKVPEPLRRVLLRALQKDPGERFQSADDFARALQEAVRGAGVDEAFAAGEGDLAETLVAPPPVPTTPPEGTQPPSGGAPTVLAPGTAPPAVSPGPTATTAPPDAVAGATRDRRRLVQALTALLVVLAVAVAGYLYLRRDVTAGGGEADTGVSTDVLSGIDFGTYKALVIGNDNYAYMPDLETATRDARDLAQVLEDRYGFQITLLLDAEREKLIDTLSRFTGEAEPTDNLLIYYAGHGSLQGRREQGVWLPVDAQPMTDTNWIYPSYEVTTLLEESRARHILVVADSCYSASMAAGRFSQPIDDGEDRQPLSRERILAALRQPARLVVASGDLKPVADSGGDGHSIFSGALIEVLQQNQGLLPVESLYEQLTARVVDASERLGAPQRPQFGELDGAPVSGGEFFLYPAAGG